ncbi:MAG: zinc ribbon domain-containing protein [Lachnospiraceae bacterium]|nr:zinc ribbon domain-containing protein [Lachnospiraceae bacterium]
MKKIIETVKILSECPNCGAARVDDEKNCRFCGSSLIETESMQERIEEEPAEKVVFRNSNNAEIVSGVSPVSWQDCWAGLLVIIFLAAFALVNCVFLVSGTDSGESGKRILVCGAMAVAAAVVTAWPVFRYRRVLSKGTEQMATVEALVMSVGSNSIRPSARYDTAVRLTAILRTEIDGEEKTVSVELPVSASSDDYPAGKKVKVRVLGRGVAICE